MSFGFGVGDILAVSNFALKLYDDYKNAPHDFKDFSDEIKSLHIVIKNHESAFHQDLQSERKRELIVILQGCENVLKDLDDLMKKYQRLAKPQPAFKD